jgi:hypothetical protein
MLYIEQPADLFFSGNNRKQNIQCVLFLLRPILFVAYLCRYNDVSYHDNTNYFYFNDIYMYISNYVLIVFIKMKIEYFCLISLLQIYEKKCPWFVTGYTWYLGE